MPAFEDCVLGFPGFGIQIPSHKLVYMAENWNEEVGATVSNGVVHHQVWPRTVGDHEVLVETVTTILSVSSSALT